jgi:hypothetical protein
MRLISAGSLVRAQSGPIPNVGGASVSRSVWISQNRHTTATESSREAFNLTSWILTLCNLRFFQSQWFLKKFAPREKCSRTPEIGRLAWESFFAKWKTICGLPKLPSAANWDSVCVPAVGRQSWSRPISTANLIARSADKFRTSKRRDRRDVARPSWPPRKRKRYGGEDRRPTISA